MKTNKTILCACALAATLLAACSPDDQPSSPLGSVAFKTLSTDPSAPVGPQRPINDFLAFQGTYCDADPGGSCTTYLPPVANMLTWYDQDDQRAVWVDYTGLGNQWVMQQTFGQRGFGTRFAGTVSEEPMPDGSARVTVDLHGYNVMGFVTEGPDLKGSPVSFGRQVKDVVAEGMQPALGEMHMQIVFMNDAMGAPLPDLVQLIKAPSPRQGLVSMTAKFNAHGTFWAPYTQPESTGEIVLTQNGPALPDYAGTGKLNGPAASADLQLLKSSGPAVSYK